MCVRSAEALSCVPSPRRRNLGCYGVYDRLSADSSRPGAIATRMSCRVPLAGQSVRDPSRRDSHQAPAERAARVRPLARPRPRRTEPPRGARDEISPAAAPRPAAWLSGAANRDRGSGRRRLGGSRHMAEPEWQARLPALSTIRVGSRQPVHPPSVPLSSTHLMRDAITRAGASPGAGQQPGGCGVPAAHAGAAALRRPCCACRACGRPSTRARAPAAQAPLPGPCCACAPAACEAVLPCLPGPAGQRVCGP